MSEIRSDDTLEGLRRTVADLLPGAVARAAASYTAFIATDAVPDVAKEFKEHHAAGRTALAHIELMLRLARWAAAEPPAIAGAGDPAAEPGSEAALAALVADARRTVAALAGAGDEEDGDPDAERCWQ